MDCYSLLMCLEDEISNRIRISHKFPIFTIAALVARNSIGKTTLLKIQGSAGEESDLQTHHDMLLIPAVIFQKFFHILTAIYQVGQFAGPVQIFAMATGPA